MRRLAAQERRSKGVLHRMSRYGEEMVLAPGAGVSTRETGRVVGLLTGLWQDLKTPLLTFLLVRVGLSVAVYFLAPLLPASPNGVPWSAFPEQPLLDDWVRWDSGWYASIALVGYRFAADQSSNIAFLPFYPLAIRAASLLTGNVWLAGLLVSNLAFVGSLLVLFKLTQLKFGRAAAGRAVLYLSVFPSAFFFFAMYSESVYLLSVLLAFYLWERRKGWPAGVFGAAAALTRPMGIVLFLAGAARHLIEDRRDGRPWLSGERVSLLVIPAAFGGFLLFSYLSFGEPLAFLKSRESGWNEPVSLIPASHRDLFSALMSGTLLTGIQKLRLLDAASGIFFLALSVPVFRRLGPSYGVFTLGSIVMPLIVNLDGLTRYVSVIFPVFIVMGRWVPRRPFAPIAVVLSAALMVFMASMFARWYFVG